MSVYEARPDVRPGSRRREEGSALLVAVMMLILMGMIGFASLETVTRDRQVSGFQRRSSVALYAAEAGVASAASRLVGTLSTTNPLGLAALAAIAPTVPATTLGDAVIHPYGQQPVYSAVTGVAPIQWLAVGGECPQIGAMSSEVGSGSQWSNAIWEVRMQGALPDGTPAQLQASVKVCRPFN
jgi:hypothetical protein